MLAGCTNAALSPGKRAWDASCWRQRRRAGLVGGRAQGMREDDGEVGGGLDTLEFDEHSNVTAAHLTSLAGKMRITADLYVSAEGVNSRARQLLFPDWPTTPNQVPEMV